ncbi:MAG TPA: hypothetical protein RMH85_03375 [Polyangiaceae bacterium LLY-WYZ-15_(1-7)]|nr:hypothetical protein [Polyangiaceae bacterium LLY-WYZ-15_(1-7)]HJL30942.1 hypothetical protein [Polyangiaceae bacterium LLY-WYZ-15_(1-7)]
MRELNTQGLDTPRGYRVLRLLQGSIADANADLVVISTHASKSYRPSGAALRSLGYPEGLEPERLTPVFLLEPNELMGTYLLPEREDPATLVLRIPGRDNLRGDVDELEVYERGAWAVYSALAALELRDRGFARVASTVLGGQRGFDPRETLRVLMHHAQRWLEHSRYTRQVDLVLHEPEHLDVWAQAMDEVLGREAYDVAADAVVSALAEELLARLEARRFDDPEVEAKVGEPIRAVLAPEQRNELRVGRLAVPGRILAESVVYRVEKCHGVKKLGAGDLYWRIERLPGFGVEPWIVQHLHALRVYGNEGVHFKGMDRALIARDLPGLLASLLRVLLYWSDTL